MVTISRSEHGPAIAGGRPQPTELAARRKPTYTIGHAARDLRGLAVRLPAIWSVWLRRSVPPAFREELMVSVAQFNGCRFCAFAHVEWALAEGVSDEELTTLAGMSPADFNRGHWIVYAWAHGLIQSEFGDVSERLEQEMTARYTSGERRRLETIVRLMTFMNLSGNTLDALLNRRKRRAVPGSRLIDELVIGGTFAAGMLPISLFLSVKRRKSPLRLVREFLRFSVRFDGSATS